MKIELKNIRYSESLSEDSNAFTANIYIDGKHAGYARNDGRGGETSIQPKDLMDWDLIKKAEAYCKTLPPEKGRLEGGKEFIDMTLDFLVDKLLTEYLRNRELQRFNRKLEKEMEKSVVVGIPDQEFRAALVFKMTVPMILSQPSWTNWLVNAMRNSVVPKLAEGQIVLNTNIPEKILREAGLKDGQYRKPQAPLQRPQQKKSGRKP